MDRIAESTEQMNKTLKKIVIFASILILLLFILFVVNQTGQVVQLADKVSPSFGNFVFWALLIVYAILVLIPIFLFIADPPLQRSSKIASTYVVPFSEQ